jgi:hypothetical protein
MNVVSVTDALNKLFQDLNNSFWVAFLMAVAGLGVLTMAILQTLKDVTPIRQWFQKHEMKRWLGVHAKVAQQNLGADTNPVVAEQQIVLLSTDADERAFYDLEIEKLCGQWNAAVQIVIDSPGMYSQFFQCVAARASKEDFEKVLKRSFPEPLPPDIEAKLDFDEHKLRLAERQSYIDSRDRVMHQVQRAVDSFQIDTSFRWKWLLQIASFVLSFVLAASAMLISTNSLNLAQTAIWALVAGFLAPVARDLLAALQKLRS